MTKILALTILGGVLLAQASQQDIRIDLYDKHGNRTGYAIVNPNTGRLDHRPAQQPAGLWHGHEPAEQHAERLVALSPA